MSIFYAYKQVMLVLPTYSMYYVYFGAHKNGKFPMPINFFDILKVSTNIVSQYYVFNMLLKKCQRVVIVFVTYNNQKLLLIHF